jgi:hypothetical protein
MRELVFCSRFLDGGATRLDLMVSRPVAVRILHPAPAPEAGLLERWVAGARAELAERHRDAFRAAGATDVEIVSWPPDDVPFGSRLRALVRAERPAGLVVLGSGTMPLATRRDYRDFVVAAGADARRALANNRYSADVVAVACAEALADVGDLPGDNALPRWLAEVAGFAVDDLRGRWRLAVDIDGPLELVLIGHGGAPSELDPEVLRSRIAGLRAIAADRRAELVVAGRVSVATLGWLERAVPARIRALVEERGLRASAPEALAPEGEARSGRAARQRPPASVLGMALEAAGPGALGGVLARLGEAAVIDSRVLLAHRLGPDERAWPVAEDRYASDLLLVERVRDPWLRELTAAAVDAPVPVLLGGHSLVGPGLRLVLGRRANRGAAWS